MKKTLSVLLAMVLCFGLCACGAQEAPKTTEAAVRTEPAPVETEAAPTEAEVEEFPYVGTWATPEGMIYLRIQEDGSIVGDSVIESSGTTTTNGVSTSYSSRQVRPGVYKFTWTLENGQFLFNGLQPYESVIENGEYWLINGATKYHRVGELDYVISEEDEDSDDQDLRQLAQEYVIGTTIQAEDIELTITEADVSDDIRITSKSSGIKITAGPSPESGKKFVYAKGTLKYTGTKETRPVFGGTIYLDEYQYNLNLSTIGTDGTPSSNIEPFETKHVLFYAHVADELVDQFADGKIVFGFNDQFKDVQVDQADYLYSVDVKR